MSDDEKYGLVAHLTNPDTRETALLELSKRREVRRSFDLHGCVAAGGRALWVPGPGDARGGVAGRGRRARRRVCRTQQKH